MLDVGRSVRPRLKHVLCLQEPLIEVAAVLAIDIFAHAVGELLLDIVFVDEVVGAH
jgi:hypothetical protein